MSPKLTAPLKVFISYSHADEAFRGDLVKHLSNLKRQGVISDWHDREIDAGTEWSSEIERHLNAADIILLLVSADFIASEYCYGLEMARALERHEAGEARVIPVLLRPCDWNDAPFSKLQALPAGAKPITKWADRDEAFLSVAQGIRKVTERWERKSSTSAGGEKVSVGATTADVLPESDRPMKILVLAANPIDTPPLRLDEEVREIDEGLRRSRHRERFIITHRWAVRIRDLRRAMLDENPQIVHFSGHGDLGGLALEGEGGEAQLVGKEALAGLFELFAEQVNCVVLNACYSAEQADAISQHIPYVVGMQKEIGDRASIEFAVGFYDALGAGRSVEDAYAFGRNAIQLGGITEHLTPMLKKKTV